MFLKRTLFGIIIFTLCFSFLGISTAKDKDQHSINITVNNNEVSNKGIEPFIINNTVMIPIRSVLTNLGYHVEWNNEFKSVFVNKGSQQIIFQINQDISYFNDKVIPMQIPITIKNNIAYIPLNFLTNLNIETAWDIENNNVIINDKFLRYAENVIQKLLDENIDFQNMEYDAQGHYSLALLNLYEKTKEEKYLALAQQFLDHLLKDKDLDHDGYTGWGLRYAWDAFNDQSINPKNTVYTYTSTVIGFAFVKAFALTGNTIYKTTANEIKETLIHSIGYWQKDEDICFWYSNSEYDKKYMVHNVNAYTIQFLSELDNINENQASIDWINKAFNYELQTVLEDGNWYYCENCSNRIKMDLVHWAFSGTAYYRAFEIYGSNKFIELARKTKKAIVNEHMSKDNTILENSSTNWGIAELIILLNYSNKHDNDPLIHPVLNELLPKVSTNGLFLDKQTSKILDHRVYSWFAYSLAVVSNDVENTNSNITLSNILEDSEGNVILNKQEWEVNRENIRQKIINVIGSFPKKEVSLNPQILSEEDKGTYIQKKVSYNVDDHERVNAYLLVPKTNQLSMPAVLTLHQTAEAGKEEVIGTTNNEDMSYGVDLVNQGYIVLAPDALAAGERIFPGYSSYESKPFYEQHRDWSMIGKAIWDNKKAVDYLQTLDIVQKDQIYVFGHSEGGVDGLFLTAFDDRISGLAISCGMGSIIEDPDPYKWSRNEWFVAIPELRSYLDKGYAPFDFHELAALVAPRPFLSFSATQDNVFMHYWGIFSIENQVKKVYQLYQEEDNLTLKIFLGNHSLPQKNKDYLFKWLEQNIQNQAVNKSTASKDAVLLFTAVHNVNYTDNLRLGTSVFFCLPSDLVLSSKTTIVRKIMTISSQRE